MPWMAEHRPVDRERLRWVNRSDLGFRPLVRRRPHSRHLVAGALHLEQAAAVFQWHGVGCGLALRITVGEKSDHLSLGVEHWPTTVASAGRHRKLIDVAQHAHSRDAQALILHPLALLRHETRGNRRLRYLFGLILYT